MQMKKLGNRTKIKTLDVNKHLIFAIFLLSFTFVQTNHFHPGLLVSKDIIKTSDFSDGHLLNTCILCSVGSQQSYGLAEISHNLISDKLFSLLLVTHSKTLSSFKLNNSERSPPSFA